MEIDGLSFDSLAELVAFALVTESQARQRYQADADGMESLGNDHLAEVFRRLAAEEAEHVARLESFVAESGMALDLDTASRQFQTLLQSERDKDLDSGFGSDRLTPYGVLARAVRNEERAFQFYCQVAATAADPQMRAYAEVFAHEELGHAALFRAERRRAYREEHGGQPRALPDPAAIADGQALLRLALDLEYTALSCVDGGSPALVAASNALLADICRELGEPRRTPDQNPLVTHADQSVYREELDHLFAVYDHIAHQSRIEEVAHKAQSLMARTLQRIELLI